MHNTVKVFICVAAIFCCLRVFARGADNSIPPGTVITKQNWQNY